MHTSWLSQHLLKNQHVCLGPQLFVAVASVVVGNSGLQSMSYLLRFCCCYLTRSLRKWYEKIKGWTLPKLPSPVTGEQPAQPGRFTTECTATDYLQDALSALFQLAPASSLAGDMETFPTSHWLLAINRALARHAADHAILLQLLQVGVCSSKWPAIFAYVI